MNQPQLGQKIQEWRKAKGMTQEELVEKCNINVRTIQRIEAGEVTPRSYTVKAILEALGVENENSFSISHRNESFQFSSQRKKIFLIGAISGCIYFLISFLEFYWDGILFFGSALEIPSYYIPLKIAVGVTFSLFFSGWFKLGEALDSGWIRWGSVFLIIVSISLISLDISLLGQTLTDYKLIGFVKLFFFGLSLIPLSIGLIHQRQQMGNLFLASGIVGLLAALFFVTFFFAIAGLVFVTIFDLMLIYLLFSNASQKEHKLIEGILA
ncbi:Helix-turn-helix [Belliella buryatensis]|uniref:Helix-turn-helix n=1 Tax=Belliella buryatensis TaxID=1500549 RepID=A0A239AIS5_9BACT|nr:helix-turn-helix transcriptional regulator [Belliella buryatensis]SNR94934.1 Helix-turn-helix [Belliella buryatensis]